MACGGCAKRQSALRGIANKPAQKAVQQVARRVGVVAQHMMRDAARAARSTLGTTRRAK